MMTHFPAFAWFGWWMTDDNGTLSTCCKIEEPCSIHDEQPETERHQLAGDWFDHPDCRIPVGADHVE